MFGAGTGGQRTPLDCMRAHAHLFVRSHATKGATPCWGLACDRDARNTAAARDAAETSLEAAAETLPTHVHAVALSWHRAAQHCIGILYGEAKQGKTVKVLFVAECS